MKWKKINVGFKIVHHLAPQSIENQIPMKRCSTVSNSKLKFLDSHRWDRNSVTYIQYQKESPLETFKEFMKLINSKICPQLVIREKLSHFWEGTNKNRGEKVQGLANF